MASKTTDCLDNICPLCNDTIHFFAVGPCDHPICHVCSTRMRVLFEQTYCAICRSQMPKVLFTRKVHKFQSINTHQFLVHRSAKIYFETDVARTSFDKLLEFQCKMCRNAKPLPSFNALKDHMRREHNLHCCDLCVIHFKIFSSERKFYDRKKLAVHRRVGDTDDTSHRGHPLCEFCDERYLDNDELVKHLRKDHYYCHFCETDGISNQFFGDYSFLREHFAEQHCLCEEDECAHLQFTNAFRSKIDLKAHKATAHCRNLNRTAARQARTLDIDFNLAPRPRMMRNRRRDADQSVIGGSDYMETEDYRRHRPSHLREDFRNQDRNAEEMQRAISMSMVTAATETTSTAYGGQPMNSISRYSDNFPTMAQQNSIADRGTRDSHSATMADKLTLASNLSVQGGSQAQDDFPSLGGPQRGGRRPITAPVGKVWTSKQPPVKSHVVAVVPNTNKQKSEPQKIPKPLPQKQTRSAIAWDAPGPKSAQVESGSVRRPVGPRVTASVTTGSDFPSLSSIGDSLMSSRPIASAPVRASIALAAYEIREPNKRASSAADVKKGGNDGTTVNSSVSSKKHDTTKRNDATDKRNDAANKKNDPTSTKNDMTNKKNDVTSKKNDVTNKKNDVTNKKNDVTNKKNDVTNQKNDVTNQKNDVTNKKNDVTNKKGEHKNDITSTNNATKPKHALNDSKLELGSKGDTFTSPKKSDIKQDADNVKKRDGDTNKKTVAASIPDTNRRHDTVAVPESNRKLIASAPVTTRRPGATIKSSDKDFPVLGASECPDGASWLTKTSSKHDTSKPSGKVDKSRKTDSALKSEQRSTNKSASWTNAAITSHDDFPSLKQASLASVVVGGTHQNVEETDEFTVIKGAKGRKKNKQVMEDLCRKHKFVVKVDLSDSDEEESDESSPRMDASDKNPGLNKRQKQKGKQYSDDPAVVSVGDVVMNKTIAPTSLKDCADSVSRQPIASRGTSDVKVAPPPGFAKPPKTKAEQPKTKAPPGFKAGSVPPVSLGATAQLSNGDFDKKTDDTPVNGHDSQASALPPYDYIQPENFTARNHKLIQDVQTLLDYGSDDKFGEFKTCSKEFRRGEISGEDYNDRCITIMGKECFDEVFPELVVLLPAIDKQRELLDAHYTTKKRGKSGRRGARTTVACGTVNTKSKFYTCRVCHQVLMTKERDAHLRHHDTDADFPSLEPVAGRGLYGMGSAGGVRNLAS